MFLFVLFVCDIFFFFSSRRRHTRCSRDWSSDVCSSDLPFLTLVTVTKETDEKNLVQRANERLKGFPRYIRVRSEEHTSELQSRLHLVCRLLLEETTLSTCRVRSSPRRLGNDTFLKPRAD